MNDETILSDQVAYYRARAGEYDEWFLREGRYDRGPEHRAQWFGEIATIRRALAATIHDRNVLELACGTGLWTEQLAKQNRSVVAVDASPEVIAINENRVRADHVRYEVADLFRWSPRARFEAVFFAFWLSHVPAGRFDGFWATVQSALEPGGKVFFVDSQPAPEGTALDQGLGTGGVVERHLNDGRTFRVVKVFHQPAPLQERLQRLGWAAEVQATPSFFLHGTARPR